MTDRSPRYPTNVRRRLLVIVGGNLVLALVWLGLWLWRPASWWNLVLCVLFAAFGLFVLYDIRRNNPRPGSVGRT